MARLQNNLIYKNFYEKLKREWPEKADKIWEAANSRYQQLAKKYPSEYKYMSFLLYPAVALYEQMKEIDEEKAVELLKEQGTEFGEKLYKLAHSVTAIPGVTDILWKNAGKIFEYSSSEKKGYQRKNLSFDGKTAILDITRCPICDAAEKLGAKKACLAICAADKVYLNGFRGVTYHRTTSVAEGDVCDYKLIREQKKSMYSNLGTYL